MLDEIKDSTLQHWVCFQDPVLGLSHHLLSPCDIVTAQDGPGCNKEGSVACLSSSSLLPQISDVMISFHRKTSVVVVRSLNVEDE